MDACGDTLYKRVPFWRATRFQRVEDVKMKLFSSHLSVIKSYLQIVVKVYDYISRTAK